MRGSYRRIGREVLGVFASALREAVSPSSQATSSDSTNEPFQYTPLTSASGFRILHLKRVMRALAEGEDMPLRGSLIEASLDASPEYYALSYTWGDPTPCEAIELDGKRLGITANCAAALRRMLRGKTERYIWVDSICINQANTTEALDERGRQVAMMDRIYRNAIQVNVHLGEGDAASDAACEAIKSLSRFYVGAKLPGPQQEFFRRKYESLADDVLAITPEFPYGKLHGVFRLQWFRRIWVVQEVVLGRNVMFYCGKHLVHFKNMVAAADFGRLPYSKFHLDTTIRHWMTYLDYHDAMNEFIRRHEEGEPLHNFGLMLFSVLMPPATMLEATRPEDKIYGLYGVCKRFGFEMPAPDYHKPLAMVYTEAARAMIRYGPGVELLLSVCESSGWEWGLPSWVPNFSGCIRKWTPSAPPTVAMFGSRNPGVSGHTQWRYELKLDGQALQVHGRRLDLVCASGLPWMTDAMTSMLGDSPTQTGQILSSFVESIGSWYDTLQGRTSSQDAKATAQLLVRLLTHDAVQSRHITADHVESFVQCLLMMATSPQPDGHPHRTAPSDSEEDRDHDSQSANCFLNPGVQAFAKIVANSWKTVFRTLGGHVGLGTHTLRDGDIVAVLHGSPLAAILRPHGTSFKYVGPAHVDGIMNGEFWASGSAADDEPFLLI